MKPLQLCLKIVRRICIDFVNALNVRNDSINPNELVVYNHSKRYEHSINQSIKPISTQLYQQHGKDWNSTTLDNIVHIIEHAIHTIESIRI